MSTLNSALFVDFDNVATELSKEDYEVYNKFCRRPKAWLDQMETNLELYPSGDYTDRRIIARRCYATPWQIERNRENFTRNGFEVIDCPPLTSRLKNSADIYIVIDIIDYIDRYPYIDEYIILSMDADFHPYTYPITEISQTIGNFLF